MSGTTFVTLLALIAAIAITAPPLGYYMAKVYGGEGAPGDRFFLPIERRIFKICRVYPEREQRWTTYALSLLAFSLVGVAILYVQLRLQNHLGLDPTGVGAVQPALAFSTAISFVTNTNWQSYAGETTMSNLSQMAGLAVQNYVSAAAGIAVVVAVIRGLSRTGSNTIGNFWVDMTRTVIRVLLPLTFVVAILLAGRGVVQNFDGNMTAHTVQGTTQVVPGGAVASQEAVKQFATNGGGYYNVNSAHPFENPDAYTNFLETYGILLIPFAMTFMFGRMVKDKRQGMVLFAAMFLIWIVATSIIIFAEGAGNPNLTKAGANQSVTTSQSGGNMEGKDVRIGSGGCAIWAGSTTGTSNGSVNCMHDSLTPIGGGTTLTHIVLGEVSPGGVGVGLNGMLVFAILAVFICGLMVGRTPEYLGKKIQAPEMKLVVIFIIAMPLAVLAFTGASLVLDSALKSILNPGPHGLSEVLYAQASAGNNNGSAFAGLNANTQWYNATLGIGMLIGRFFLLIPILAIAGSLGRKQRVPASAGTFPTHTPLFVGLLIGVAVIIAGLTFFPALALGPIVEQLSL